MDDTEPQTAAAKVLWHFTMSLDGSAAGSPGAAQALDREGMLHPC